MQNLHEVFQSAKGGRLDFPTVGDSLGFTIFLLCGIVMNSLLVCEARARYVDPDQNWFCVKETI
jgi:hypothetical protein